MSSPTLATRSFVVLAHADELLDSPELIDAYARTFGADDDVTLAIYAPDTDGADVARALAPHVDIDADLMLIAVGSDSAAEVASRVDCLYSRRLPTGAFGSLVRVDDTRVEHLRTMAADRAPTAAPAPVEPVAPRGAEWRASETLGGPDATMPERAFPGMIYGNVMQEHAFRYAWALKHVDGLRALDLGCGTAYGSEMLTWTAATVDGFDLWEPGDSETPSWPGGATLHYGHDLCVDPLPEADVAVMFEVVEHLADAPAALRRAWQSASTLVISFPNPTYHGSHHNPYHVNDWTLDEVEEKLRETAAVRFSTVEFTHAHQLGDGLIRDGRDPASSYWLVVAAGSGAAPARSNGAVPKAARDTMKREWNARARENAMHYIASGKPVWETEEFYASGEENIRDYVVSELDLLVGGRDPKGLRALDIGCGVGRLTRALGGVFGEAHGIDVSGEMVAQGTRLLAEVPNVHLHEGSGADLAPFADEFFDFVFSYIVFQHVPERDAVVSYLREAHRVLTPGSFFKFQVQGFRHPQYLAQPNDTWNGVSFSAEEMDALAAEIGFDVVSTDGAGTQYFWLWWRKQ